MYMYVLHQENVHTCYNAEIYFCIDSKLREFAGFKNGDIVMYDGISHF